MGSPHMAGVPDTSPTPRGHRWQALARNSIDRLLANPVYAGAYAFGKIQRECILGLEAADLAHQRGVNPPPTAQRRLLRDHFDCCSEPGLRNCSLRPE